MTRSRVEHETIRKVVSRVLGAIEREGVVVSPKDSRDFLQVQRGDFLVQLHPEPDYVTVIVCHRRHMRVVLSASIFDVDAMLFDVRLHVGEWDRSRARAGWLRELLETFPRETGWLLDPPDVRTFEVARTVQAHVDRLLGPEPPLNGLHEADV